MRLMLLHVLSNLSQSGLVHLHTLAIGDGDGAGQSDFRGTGLATTIVPSLVAQDGDVSNARIG